MFFASRIFAKQGIVGLTSGSAVALGSVFLSNSSSTIKSEGKRKFYQDLEDELVVPGTNSTISKQLLQKETPNESKNSEVSFVDGMTIRSSEVIEQNLNNLRKWTIDHLDYYFYEYQTAKSSFKNELLAISSKYHAIVVEPVLPNLIYILTGALSGSVLVNRRALPVRFFTPLVFGTTLYAYLMPQSFNNTREHLWRHEKENFPQVAQQHIQFLISLEENKQLANKKLEESNTCLISKVHSARKYIMDILN